MHLKLRPKLIYAIDSRYFYLDKKRFQSYYSDSKSDWETGAAQSFVLIDQQRDREQLETIKNFIERFFSSCFFAINNFFKCVSGPRISIGVFFKRQVIVYYYILTINFDT
jgi:hypothetical protein